MLSGRSTRAEHVDECLHGSWVRGMVQQDCVEVVAQGAAGAYRRGGRARLLVAGRAGEVAGDAGAGQADRLVASVRARPGRTPSWPQPGQMPWVRIAV